MTLQLISMVCVISCRFSYDDQRQLCACSWKIVLLEPSTISNLISLVSLEMGGGGGQAIETSLKPNDLNQTDLQCSVSRIDPMHFNDIGTTGSTSPVIESSGRTIRVYFGKIGNTSGNVTMFSSFIMVQYSN